MRAGFTLIELLVVITIIVVLLALLTPALDKAIYQAELTVCAANMKGIATGVTSYAAAHGRAYPYRPTIISGSWKRPNVIFDAGGDDRRYYRDYITDLSMVDPLSGKIDVRAKPGTTEIFVNYELWWGMKYATADGGKGLYRLGDRMEWTDRSRGRVYEGKFDILASDEDLIEPSYDFKSCASHPDEQRLTYLQVLNGATVISRWILYVAGPVETPRGEIDENFAFTDASVTRVNNVTWDDSRMARVPLNAAATPADVGSGHWIHLPLE